MTEPKPKIYVFVNSRMGTDLCGMALAEDGTFLGGHVSSSREFFRHDMGLTSERKHDAYSHHYPTGYELVEVPDDEVTIHLGLAAAHRRNAEAASVAKDAGE